MNREYLQKNEFIVIVVKVDLKGVFVEYMSRIYFDDIDVRIGDCGKGYVVKEEIVVVLNGIRNLCFLVIVQGDCDDVGRFLYLEGVEYIMWCIYDVYFYVFFVFFDLFFKIEFSI